MHVALIYDDRDRPETTGGYCLRAFRELSQVIHACPDQLRSLNPSEFDLFVRVDDGLEYILPAALRPLVWWAIDTHLDLDRCLAQARCADLTYAAQKPGAEALRRAGIASAEWLPLACDPNIHRPHETAKRYDFSFVGNLFPGPRAELIELLCRHFPSHFVGRAYFDDLARVYSESRITFNRSIRDDLNMRVFEALACGSLLVTNELTAESGQGELFRDGTHFANYRDPEELLDKLRFYVARPETRTKVERAGREEVVAKHTYRHRMQSILSAAERLPRKASVSTPSASPAAVAPSRSQLAYDPGYFEFARPELLELIPQTARDVVDVGCAAGRLGEALKARQSCRVVGIEHNPVAASAARTRLDCVIEGDAENLEWPFPPHSFDAVVCGDVLEHLRDPLAFLREVRDWLRADGVVVISLPNVRNHTVIRGLLEGDWTYEPAGLLDHTHLRFFTRREIEKLLYRAGFGVPALIPVPGPGYPEWHAAGRPGEVAVGGLRVGPLDPEEALEFYTYQWLAAARPAKAPEAGLTSIVILTHDQLPLTRQCIDSIRLLTDQPYELVFVDNCSTDGTPEYLKTLSASDERVKVILNTDNRGFPAGCNQGIQVSRGEQVLLLNNDTVVTTGWLGRILRALHSGKEVGLVGPCSNRVSGEQQIAVSYSQPDLVGLDGFAWRWGQMHDQTTAETDRLVGFCLLIKRAVIDKVGLLDEQFGIGNFEDDDYCLRARRAGFRTLIARDAFVHHIGGATFSAVDVNYAQLLQRNAERFRTKWSNGSTGQEATSHQPAPVTSPTLPELVADQPFIVRALESGGLLLERSGRGKPCGSRRLLVSGCLIVRDNARTIRACLESLRPWVDELIVVDTGSKDDTPRIAAELGARVFHFPWIDDFSAARNESVRHACGEWIFWMDSDDAIPSECGRKLREFAANADPATLGFTIDVHCPGPNPADEVTVVTHVKLFRNRPELRFEHRIHEQILPAIIRTGGEVKHTDLYVVHSGYDHTPEGQARKLERDLRILHAELREQPHHPFTLFNLGMTYTDVQQYEEALHYLDRCIEQSGGQGSHLRKAFVYAVVCYQSLGRHDRAMAACEEGLRLFPLDAELRFRRGLLLHQQGKLREAVAAYHDVLDRHEPPHFSSMVAGIESYLTRHNLAVVYEELGELNNAEKQWQLILAERPEYRLAWRALGGLLLRQRKIDEATGVAGKLLGDVRLRSEGLLLRGRVAAARGNLSAAREDWDRVVTSYANDHDAISEVARLLFEQVGPATARGALEALIRLAPSDALAHHNLGIALLQTSEAERAVAACREALRLRPDSPETQELLKVALGTLSRR
jgi:GT2 family glycosyltransferase/tetratricopeptide (TPR) repeat protein/SAM-dependent methyltransferase